MYRLLKEPLLTMLIQKLEPYISTGNRSLNFKCVSSLQSSISEMVEKGKETRYIMMGEKQEGWGQVEREYSH